jgi:teichuronic acid biosynthesis glycosyltransferase TuaH
MTPLRADRNWGSGIDIKALDKVRTTSVPPLPLACAESHRAPRVQVSSETPIGLDLVVADASWIWTERRFRPLADHEGVRVLLIKACDWRNAIQKRLPIRDWFFPLRRLGPNLWEQTCVLPPGWMKSYPTLGMRPIASAIGRWRRELDEPRPFALAISYPQYLSLRDLVKPDALFYYNMDDYSFYWTSRRESVRQLEHRAVRESDLTLVCARVRTEELRQAVPEAASRVIHLPHGAPASAIALGPQDLPASPPEDIAHLPRPLLGFVGSLEDRVDWNLVGQLAAAIPEGSIILVGREPSVASKSEWHDSYRRAVARPNVHRVGWRPQADLGRYNASFDVCLIPYQTNHPFNIASCPTKLMDYMATSRPVVTTALPECRLYADLFAVAESPDEFIAAVKTIVDRGSDDGRSALRWEAARAGTWERTSEALLQRLREATREKLKRGS